MGWVYDLLMAEPEEEKTTTIRIRTKAHDTFRYISYVENKKIIDIVDELLAGRSIEDVKIDASAGK